MFKRAKAFSRRIRARLAERLADLKPATSAKGIGKWLANPNDPNGPRSLCATRSGSPGTVAQDKRRAAKKRNRK